MFAIILSKFYSDMEMILDEDAPSSAYTRMVESFAKMFEEDNPNFDWNKFYESCFIVGRPAKQVDSKCPCGRKEFHHHGKG
ncbi:hypothetical protein LCGC14_2384990 [marine sediment metagenome]|uniref:Uncharacterized protein n=1 Tax=marine sediment metagenome TaxID=412755 RepID=A0A0F9EC63_9ZZZZ